ncbi:MAG: 16S rRNA (guanine(527)-N(7))-methyltransferase RsmG [Chitinophagales bacterium]|nr:16S rRNA (guanine(527)-N(7))-methyltransferase RsmG [Chitinophagales bacterium]
MDSLLQYFPYLSKTKQEQFSALMQLYPFWNEQINVISRKDIEHLYTNHILHSLAIAKFIQFENGSKVLDIGTGGGFPGIPLAILFPEVEFHLTDSIGKKIKVVQAIANEINLDNVIAVQSRSEEYRHQFDFVVSRAVAPMTSLVTWSNGKFLKRQINSKPNGIIALKGGDLSEELAALKNGVELIPISEYFKEAFFSTKQLVYYCE